MHPQCIWPKLWPSEVVVTAMRTHGSLATQIATKPSFFDRFWSGIWFFLKNFKPLFNPRNTEADRPLGCRIWICWQKQYFAKGNKKNWKTAVGGVKIKCLRQCSLFFLAGGGLGELVVKGKFDPSHKLGFWHWFSRAGDRSHLKNFFFWRPERFEKMWFLEECIVFFPPGGRCGH